jgi:hypothetical protein
MCQWAGIVIWRGKMHVRIICKAVQGAAQMCISFLRCRAVQIICTCRCICKCTPLHSCADDLHGFGDDLHVYLPLPNYNPWDGCGRQVAWICTGCVDFVKIPWI